MTLPSTFAPQKEMAAHLEACVEEADGDAAFIAKALGDIAKAKGMTQVARENNDNTSKLMNRALAQLDAGTYGLCSNCGQPIGERRLQALPYSDRCITCAEAAG